MKSFKFSLFITIFILFNLIGCAKDGAGLNPVFALILGQSPTSGGGDGGPIIPTDDVPGWVTATDAVFGDKVEITWQSVTNAQNYIIFRKKSNESTFQQIGTTSDTIFSDPNVDAAITYQYSIKAVTGNSTPMSSFDTGWRANSAGCVAKLDLIAGSPETQFAKLKGLVGNVFFSVLPFNKSLLVANGGIVSLLNENRDITGAWINLAPVGMVSDSANRIFAVAGRQLLRLNPDCETEILANLPADSFPTDLAIDASGNLYVSEFNTAIQSDRIFQFDRTGALLQTWDLPGVDHRPRAIVIQTSDNTLLVADEFHGQLFQYGFNGDQLTQITAKNITIGTVNDLVMVGPQIIVIVQSNSNNTFGPNITRFHSGINGGSVTSIFNPDSPAFNMYRIQGAAIDPITAGLYFTENSTLTVFQCPAPLYLICTANAAGIFPAKMVRDDTGNFYVLHGSPRNFISKLNPNGATLNTIKLPKFLGTTIAPIDIEIEKDILYVSAINNDLTTALVKIKTDFTTSSVEPFKAFTGFGLPNLAVTKDTIYNDVLSFGDTSDIIYVTSTQISNGEVFDFIDSPFQKFFIQGIQDLEADQQGHLYSMNSSFTEEGTDFVTVSRFDLKTLEWANVFDVEAADAKPLQIVTDKIGNLYSIDLNSTNDGLDIVKRDVDFNPKAGKFSTNFDFFPDSLSVTDTGEEAFMTSAAAIHRFAFSEANLFKSKQNFKSGLRKKPIPHCMASEEVCARTRKFSKGKKF